MLVIGLAAGSFAFERAHTLAQVVSTFSISSCTETATAHTGELPNGDYFVVQVNYSGMWTALITTYSAFADNSSYLHSTLCFGGSGNTTTLVQTWNLSGEESTWVTAKKLDSSNANLSVTVGYGAYFRTNSTIAPLGMTQTFVAIAP